jgi:hypothetical protein
MLFLKELLSKTQKRWENTKKFIIETTSPLIRSIRTTILFLSRVYGSTVVVVSKAYRFLARVLGVTTRFIMATSSKIYRIFQYIHRRLYVWKILSVRHRWYRCKQGGYYNPKLKSTIKPSWACSWNLTRTSDHYKGIESKEQAQHLAFKIWMKRRLIQKRLERYDHEIRIPIKFTEKILLNPTLTNKIALRAASTNDLPDLLTLTEQIGYSKDDEGMNKRIRRYLENSNHHILIATKGKTVVGFIAFIIYDLFLSEGKRCHIEGMVVDANQNDLSVKRKLMQAAESFARENKSIIIDLVDGMCRTKDGSYDFYKFLGYNSDGNTTRTYLKKEL